MLEAAADFVDAHGAALVEAVVRAAWYPEELVVQSELGALDGNRILGPNPFFD